MYHTPEGVALDGAVDPEAISAALDRVVEAHQVLCCGISAGPDGTPVATPLDRPRAGFAQCDLSTLEGPALEAALVQARRRAAQAAFDLANGPLLRGAADPQGRRGARADPDAAAYRVGCGEHGAVLAGSFGRAGAAGIRAAGGGLWVLRLCGLASEGA